MDNLAFKMMQVTIDEEKNIIKTRRDNLIKLFGKLNTALIFLESKEFKNLEIKSKYKFIIPSIIYNKYYPTIKNKINDDNRISVTQVFPFTMDELINDYKILVDLFIDYSKKVYEKDYNFFIGELVHIHFKYKNELGFDMIAPFYACHQGNDGKIILKSCRNNSYPTQFLLWEQHILKSIKFLQFNTNTQDDDYHFIPKSLFDHYKSINHVINTKRLKCPDDKKFNYVRPSDIDINSFVFKLPEYNQRFWPFRISKDINDEYEYGFNMASEGTGQFYVNDKLFIKYMENLIPKDIISIILNFGPFENTIYDFKLFVKHRKNGDEKYIDLVDKIIQLY